MTVNFGMVNPYMTTMMDAPLMSPYAGMGMGAGFGMLGGISMNPQQYMQNIQQWDNFGINRQVAAYQNQNNAQFQMQAQNGSIQRQVQILAQEIRANNQDNVKAEYGKLLQAIRSSYGSQLQGTEEEKELTLKQYADQVYTQVTGSYMTEDLKAHGRSSFADGFMRTLSLGMGNKTSVDENLEFMTGAKRTGASKASNTFGKVLGTICTLGLGLFGW